MDTTPSNSSKLIAGIVIIIVIIGVGTYLITRGGAKDENGTAPTFSNGTPIVDGITVKDQLTGNSVIVSDISLSKPGFVVIRTVTGRGDVLGSKYFERGERPGIIDISIKTKNGAEYGATLYEDTNGNKTYDEGVDAMMRNAAGEALGQTFKTFDTLPDIKA